VKQFRETIAYFLGNTPRAGSTYEGKLRITIEGQRVPIDLNHRCDDDLIALAWASLARRNPRGGAALGAAGLGGLNQFLQ